MKYLPILLASATTLLITVEGKIPDYIQICKANEPEINKCIHNSILSLREKLVEGIPELNVPSIDPLRLDKLSLNLGTGFKAEGRNLVVKGGKNFSLRDLVVDIDANTYSFTVEVPEMITSGTYEIDAALGSIPLKGKGPIHLISRSIIGRATLQGKKAVRGGKTFNWFPSMSLKIEIGDYDIKLENLFEGDPTIGQVTNKLLNEEKTEVLAAMLPAFEKALIEHTLLTANNICKNFTWDELFPKS